MQIIPAIDLLDGNCVRLYQGSYNQVKNYSDKPVQVAKYFETQGAEWIHVVDLTGAKKRSPCHVDVLKEICASTSLKVEYSGGLRSLEDVTAAFEAGASKIVLGTMLIENPEEAKKIITRFGPEKIVGAIDMKDGQVATRGWEKSSGIDETTIIKIVKELGIQKVIVTDISRDGTLEGVDIEILEKFLNVGFEVTASGGVKDYGDIVKLKRVGAWGMITGKAIYEGRIDLKQAISISKTENKLAKRVIPCLDIKDGQVVKGTHFKDLQIIGDAVEMAKKYDAEGADELTFLDIAATEEERKNRADLVSRVAAVIHIPFTIGGGISSIEDIRTLLNAGADKVSIGSAAVRDPKFVKQAVQTFGSQCIVISLDVKRSVIALAKGNNPLLERSEWFRAGEIPLAKGDRFTAGEAGGYTEEPIWRVYIKGGKEGTQKDAIEFSREMEAVGVGEILVNSLDRDGTQAGFDIPLLKAITDAVNIPVIASSGAGRLEDFKEVIEKSNVDAVLAASLFHNNELTIQEVKSYLLSKNIPVRT